MRYSSVLSGAAVVAVISLSGCGSSPSSPGPGGTRPSIYATVDWTIVQTKLFQSLGIPIDTTISASVNVYHGDNSKDSTATVSMVLKGVTYPLAWSGNNSAYVMHTSTIPKSAVKNGDMVVVTVKVGSTTYADSAIMPGGISVSNDGTSATWATEGNFDDLVVYPLDANDIPVVSNALVSSVEGKGGLTVTADLTSPVTIPQTALSSGQWYEVEILAQRESYPFADLSGYIHVRAIYMKDYQKP